MCFHCFLLVLWGFLQFLSFWHLQIWSHLKNLSSMKDFASGIFYVFSKVEPFLHLCNNLSHNKWVLFTSGFYCCFSHQVVSDIFVTPWTITLQAPLSMGFPRQKYCCGLPFPSPGDLPNQQIEPISPASLTLAGMFFTTEPPEKPLDFINYILIEYLQCTRYFSRMSAEWMLQLTKQTKSWLTWSLNSRRRTLIIIKTHRYVSEGR